MRRKKVAILHPEVSIGGGEAVFAWTLEALKNNYDISVITTSNIDFHSLNSFYSTNIYERDLRVYRVSPFAAGVDTGFLYKRHLVMRYCKAVAHQYDLLFSTQNEMDFGVQGVQYLHFPIHAEQLMRSLNQMPKHWYYHNAPLRQVYRRICETISEYSQHRIKQNLTLVNSNWTGDRVKEAYGIDSITVYPPVLSDIPRMAWQEREQGFVCVGWIVPNKRIENIVEILRLVRQEGFDVHLHIIGPVRNKSYGRLIKRLCETNKEWVRFEGLLERGALASLVARHRYGIHGFETEHFGIAVAEMTKAGCIVFVPDGGGQKEIVPDSRLHYSSLEEAAEKIVAVLSKPELQAELSHKVFLNSQKFSVEVFVAQVREIVNAFLAAQ